MLTSDLIECIQILHATALELFFHRQFSVCCPIAE